MSDHSSMATLQNNQPGGFAAAAQRARLIAAKIVVAGGTKRPLEEGPESSPKKLAPVDQGYTASSMSAAAIAAAAAAARIGGSQSSDQTSPPGSMSQSNLMPDQANDYIRVPDKMVGLNRQTRIGGAQSAGHAPPHHLMPEETFEYIRVPDDQFGYLIGRGGEQITRLQADSGCKIQMASDSGQPDRLVTLTGTRDAINRAKELVNLIVNHRGRENASDMPNMGNNNPMPRLQGGGGGGGGGNGGGGGGGLNAMEEIMLPGPKVGLIIGKSGKTIKQLQEQSGAKMVVIQDGPNTEYEKPLRISGEPAKVDHAKQLVFELLAEKDMQFTGGMRQQQFEDSYQQQEPGNGLGGGNSTEVLVPRIAVGVVIGRGGDMIKKIQNETGCRVQFHQERDEGPGDKRCFLQGKQHQVEQAKEMIEDLITSVTRREQDNRNKPRQQRNGGGGDFNQQQQWQSSPDGQEVRVSFSVNNVKCGLIIGRGGEVIKQINAQSGAHCELDRRAQNADRNNRTFYIKGHPDAVENCKRIIMEKVGMPVNFMAEGSNGNGGNGGGGPPSGEFYQGGPSDSGNGGPQQPGGGWGYNPQWHPANAQPPQQKNQVAINPVTGQPDYSQQWISYYRSMGMVREAEAIEQQKAQQIQQHQQQQQQQQQQQPQPQSQPQPQPQPQPQMSDFQGMYPGAGPSAGPSNAAPVASQSSSPGPAAVDYSAQWADYYRNLGMLKEAEAIELQIKLKQQQAQQSQSQPQPVVPGPSQGAPVGGPSVTAPGPMGGMYDQQYQVGFPGPGPSAGYSYQSYQYPGGQPGPSGDPHQQ